MICASVLTFAGAMHAYQVYDGISFDFLFRFVEPVAGGVYYRANDLAISYLLCGLFFFSVSRWAKSQPVQLHQ